MAKITQHASAAHEEIIPFWTAAHKDFIDRTAEQWDSKMERFVDHDAPPKQRVDSPRTPQWDPKTESFSHDAPPKQRAYSPRTPQWDPKTESFSHDAPPTQRVDSPGAPQWKQRVDSPRTTRSSRSRRSRTPTLRGRARSSDDRAVFPTMSDDEALRLYWRDIDAARQDFLRRTAR